MNKEKIVLHEVLMLLMDNERTSASKYGLSQRAINRKEAISKILSALNYSVENADDFYWDWENSL